MWDDLLTGESAAEPRDAEGATEMFGTGQVPVADPAAVEQMRRELGAGPRQVRFQESQYQPVHGLAEEIGLQ